MKRKVPVRGVLFVYLLFESGGPLAWAAEEARCRTWVGRLVSVQGVVEVRPAGQQTWRPQGLNALFCPGDSVRLGEHSRADVLLHNETETTLRLDQYSILSFIPAEEQARTWLELLKGAVHFISRIPRRLEVKTPYVNAAVEGTEFLVRVEPQESRIWVFEGLVRASNAQGEVTLTPGQLGLARASQAPVAQRAVRPRDAVQWALYYPPILNARAAAERAGEGRQEIRDILGAYQKNDLPDAFARLEAVPAARRDADYFTLRADLLLSVGRVEEARAALQQALALDPRAGQALARQAVIALVQNQPEQALELARQAVELAPQAAAPRQALSYAYQGVFDLKQSLASAREAVRLDDADALAWARVAELELSQGELKRALEAAQKAVARNPRLARTQTVLGFAYLAEVEVRQARAAFERAIELDQADPLPRLGLGLALIRRGKLTDGREQLAVAVSLDVNQSLLRSYLGKAYYEEKRDRLAEGQLNLAKELDPRDPTPWYYSAILRQTENRPVEALEDLQRSIGLNDNRAVYRSRQLLDQDQAARNASLGRIYNELDFQQLGLRQGWQSVNTDPASFSGHRLLADTYAILPRHEIARVSELLQAQLLQPLNFNLIQPQLALSNLGIIGASGPSKLAFNEFNPLFVRNGLAAQANGVAGGNGTLGDDLVLSGLQDKFAYSFGQFHYETDGFRENSDQQIDIYNVLLQAAPSYNASIQAEYRFTDSERGDLQQRLSGFFDPSDRQQEQTRLARLGFRYGFTPNTDLLVSFAHEAQDFKGGFAALDPPGQFSLDSKRDGNSLELQQLYRSEKFNLVAGGGYITQDVDQLVTLATPFFTASSVGNNTVEHANFYLYSRLSPVPALSFTLGASADYLNGIQLDHNQFNPKLGLIWQPWPDVTVRTAAFRTLARTFIATQQTLEPTQVAGFNQLYNDAEATETWRYGIALDKKFSASLYTGIELSRRDLSVPLQAISTRSPVPQLDFADWEEHSARAYLYWAPMSWLAASGEFAYERYRRDPDFPDKAGTYIDLETRRLGLGVAVFNEIGWRGALSATYADQDSEAFGGLNLDAQFWVVDASIGYRLPKRYGQLSLEAKNLFDEKFNYDEIDPANPLLYPERLVLARFTLAL